MKIDPAEWLSRPGIGRLLEALDAAGGSSRFVGGAVRDLALGLEAADLDLATRLQPAEVIERLDEAGIKTIPTGLAHGTVTAVSSGTVVEVTTLRSDVATDGRHAVVAFTGDWAADAARRDFTINALYADPLTGDIIDPTGEGEQDLAARRVRFIGAPLARIAEDHLRILRFFRFHARFATGAPDGPALDACTSRANDLMALSRERIADELAKLLALPDPLGTVRLMVERAILKPVLPEIDGEAVARLERLVAAETAAGLPADRWRRLAALLPPDSSAAERIAARLKLSNKLRKRLALAAGTDQSGPPQALAYRFGPEGAVDRLLLAGRPDEAASLSGWTPPRLPLSGGALIARGVPQGPEVARTLRSIERQWIDKGFPAGPELEAIVAAAIADGRTAR